MRDSAPEERTTSWMWKGAGEMDTMTELYWDPFDEELDSAPHAVWRRMRDEAPVYRNDRYDFWALSRFTDVENAHRDTATFSSARGTVLEMMGSDLSGTGQIIFMDPPEHTHMRALVSRAFTPRQMAKMEDYVRELCAELLDPLAGAERFDYIADFASQVPSRVISHLVGVPESDREEQRTNIDEMFHIEPGVGMVNDVSLHAQIRLFQYLRALIDRRLVDPADDLISILCHAEVVDDAGDRRRLTPDEIASFSLLLYGAGTETVMRLLGNAAVLLAEHADQRADLVANPDVIPNAIEELLRYEAPSPVQGRWTTAEVVLHGTTIPAESKVLLLTGSAGRDDRVFPDSDRFDVRREMKTHASFGYGIHFCVGAALARLEGKVALEETLKRFPAWDVDPAGVVRQHTSTVRGYSSVVIVPG
jgi:cytochrome P450